MTPVDNRSADADGWHGGPLVGRDRELAALRATLAGLSGGSSRVVEIAGDPGHGKTRILLALANLARDRNLLTADLPAAPDAPAAQALRDRLAAPHPVVLTIDDAHHAGGERLALIDHLLRRRPRAPLVLALAHRPRQTPDRLRTALDNAAGLIRLPLAALTTANIGTLLGPRVAPVWHGTLHERSGGNPFYLKALLQLPPPYLTGADAELGPLPPAVRAAVAAEIDALSPAARLAAYAAAVVDDSVEPHLVGEVAGLDGNGLSAAVDELVAHDIVRAVPGTGCFVFRHPVLRHLIYAEIDAGWRVRAHARAERVLELRRAPAVTRAVHLARVAMVGAAAVRVLAEAAEVVAQRRPDTAARWLVAALRLAPTGTLDEHSALLRRLCRALARAGSTAERRETLGEIMRLLPEVPGSLRLVVVAYQAQLERLLRAPAEARRVVRSGLAELPDNASAEPHWAVAAAVLALELACAYLSRPGAAQSRAHAAEALAVAHRRGDRAVEACALGVLAVANCLTGAFPVAAGQTRRAARMVDALLDHQLAGRLDAALWVGVGQVLLDRPREALPHLDRAVEIGTGAGDHLTSLYLFVCRAVALRAVGRLADATADATAAGDLAAASGSRGLGAMVDGLRRWIGIWTGERLAPRAAAGPTEPADGEPDLFATFELTVRAEVLLAAGDHHGCTAMLTATNEPDLQRIDPWFRVAWYELLTRAALRAGRTDDAEEWAGRAGAVAGTAALDGRRGVAALAEAQALAPRDPVAAASAALRAVADLAAAGLVLDAARARLVAGAALAAADRSEQAVDELSLAADCFAACGARPLERDATARLRRIGHLPRPARGVEALTRREREVAGLVTSGLTNRQIAARLFVTEKTVEMHLSHVFAKLGVVNRAGVAREFSLA